MNIEKEFIDLVEKTLLDLIIKNNFKCDFTDKKEIIELLQKNRLSMEIEDKSKYGEYAGLCLKIATYNIKLLKDNKVIDAKEIKIKHFTS